MLPRRSLVDEATEEGEVSTLEEAMDEAWVWEEVRVEPLLASSRRSSCSCSVSLSLDRGAANEEEAVFGG